MGKRVIIGQNDIATTHPHLSQEWNYERNGSVFPTDVSSGSSKRVWWRCKEGHEWEAVVASRTSGYGCPYCAGQRVLVGKNDLASLLQLCEGCSGLQPRQHLPQPQVQRCSLGSWSDR